MSKPHERISEAKRNADAGPVFLQNSFRPFFLAAGLWAFFAIPFWILNFTGQLDFSSILDAHLWHQHEMLYGFAGAAITGFILTAIPNWTGRLPVSGWRLGALFALWSIGRIGFLVGDAISPWAIACLDFSFLFSLTFLISRELIAGKNWRNLPVLVLISLFTTGNFLFHLERTGIAEMAETGMRLSTFVLAILIAVIGGRIVPSFTRNFLVKKGITTLPAPISNFDTCSLVALACFVIAKTAAPDHLATAGLALAAGLLHGIRLMRWKSWTILSEPLMWVLHLGYGWLVVSLLINAAAGFTEKVPAEAATHALTVGAFATMILAVMTRTSLGHTGRKLAASRPLTLIFALITIAATIRVGAPFADDWRMELIWISGIAWTAAFGIFVVLFYPVLTGPRIAARKPTTPGSTKTPS